MEYLFDFLEGVATGVGAVTMIWYLILRPILNLPYKQWDRKMDNPPPPPKKKCNSCDGSGIWVQDDTPLVVYQPCPSCSGTGHINPPK